VFTARYALSPYIKQIRFVFKGLMMFVLLLSARGRVVVQELHAVSSFSLCVCVCVCVCVCYQLASFDLDDVL
jgi:hypothetical protein